MALEIRKEGARVFLTGVIDETAQLAQLELEALAEAITSDYPHARLLTPYADLRHLSPGSIMGSRVRTLPVALSGD